MIQDQSARSSGPYRRDLKKLIVVSLENGVKLKGLVRFGKFGVLLPLAVSCVLLSACGNGAPSTSAQNVSASSSSASSTSVATQKHSGSVTLLYAGSLVGAMENYIGPDFHAATGYTLNGTPGGSTGLANQIKGRLIAADVFISAAPAVNASLEGAANGGFVSWYSLLAKAPLVIGYSPASSFAPDFKSEPWYTVMSKPGIKIGRTDPALDPKGGLTVKLVQAEAAKLNQPNLVNQILGPTENPAQVFPEETLVARLNSGQLDAGFFFSNEAKLANIPTVPTGIDLGASFTVTILKGAPDEAAAVAFVKYLYSPRGQAVLTKVGLNVEKPVVVGDSGSIPTGLRSTL